MRLEGVSPQPGVALQVSLTKVKKNSLPFLDNKVLFTYVRGVYQFNPESVCSAVLTCFTRGFVNLRCVDTGFLYEFCFSGFHI